MRGLTFLYNGKKKKCKQTYPYGLKKKVKKLMVDNLTDISIQYRFLPGSWISINICHGLIFCVQ